MCHSLLLLESVRVLTRGGLCITITLSMAASFYSSPLIGATTTLACFAHEIPHEIADYSILVRSGFTKRQAMQSQFLTAIGAFVSHPGIQFIPLCSCAEEHLTAFLSPTLPFSLPAGMFYGRDVDVWKIKITIIQTKTNI